jgi:hypothetical protein
VTETEFGEIRGQTPPATGFSLMRGNSLSERGLTPYFPEFGLRHSIPSECLPDAEREPILGLAWTRRHVEPHIEADQNERRLDANTNSRRVTKPERIEVTDCGINIARIDESYSAEPPEQRKA